HDYWWNGITKLRDSAPDGTFYFLQNDCVKFENVVICGSRGWSCPGSADYGEHDEKLYLREAERFKLCFKEVEKQRKEGDKLIVMIHYPPFSAKSPETLFTKLFKDSGADKVVFGHIHGENYFSLRTVKDGIEYVLTSCDKVGFTLQRIL
ncbi:MAG: metallophosphoesterase, partial [Clostridia bacterium]|nr:metallophosphoesterase [Clostridia bacterium]